MSLIKQRGIANIHLEYIIFPEKMTTVKLISSFRKFKEVKTTSQNTVFLGTLDDVQFLYDQKMINLDLDDIYKTTLGVDKSINIISGGDQNNLQNFLKKYCKKIKENELK